MIGASPAENSDAQWYTKRCADKKWPQPAPAQSLAQLPYRDALHHETECDDQRRGLQGRKYVKPDGGRHQAEGKAREPRDERGGESRREKDCNVQNAFVHRQFPLFWSAILEALV